ncbi:MAG: aminoacyl-tRNA hydrolase, partial [candidate division Zixibacteria bacterium]
MIRALIGLGNPGKHYDGTRHNIGYAVVAHFLGELDSKSLPGDGLGRYWRVWSQLRLLTVCCPITYMNRSGAAVAALLDRQAIVPAEMLVVSDDINLPLGSVRLRKSGSDGGHNGLASIIEELETESFPRLRLGIGQPADRDLSGTDFVLGQFDSSETEIIEKTIARASKA